jgi:hypothetical protein
LATTGVSTGITGMQNPPNVHDMFSFFFQIGVSCQGPTMTH